MTDIKNIPAASRIIFSGIQPSGNLHIGNYLGSVRNWVNIQNEVKKCFFCVVDLHAITVWQDPQMLADKTREIAAIYLASGIDSKTSTLFVQSHVSEHAQLAWILNCVARVGWMNRMTQFKDKAGKNAEQVSLGLYAYPALMAADILLYNTTHVPVGEDQKQHVELARDIAQKFNHDFGSNTDVYHDFFQIPEPVIATEGARIMSLKDGTKKMSKSDDNANASIFLRDSDDEIAAKFKRATTDSEAIINDVNNLNARPEVRNLINIHAAFLNQKIEDSLAHFVGKQFSEVKRELTEVVISKLAPIREKINYYMNDKAELDKILRAGAVAAKEVAAAKLEEVYKIVGFLKI
jgi:tryptophanyl-tRNA synthetase